MKILYHHRTLGDGAEGIHIQAIVNNLIEQGHQVKTVSLIGDNTKFRSTQESKELKWDSIKSLIPAPLYELAEIVYNLKGKHLITRAIENFKPDIIYDRYAHHSFASLWAAKKFNLPLILEVNSPYAVQKTKWEKTYFPLLSKLSERQIFKAASHIIVVSTPLKQVVRDYGVSDDRITVLPNGTDPMRFNPRISSNGLKQSLGFEGKTVLGFVGILRKWHKIDKLIETLERIDLRQHNAVMLFIGDGPSFHNLVAHSRNGGHEDTIKFLGRISHAEIQRYIAMFDVAISPHATFYSSPMKILEYMAMGKAVLAPDLANIRDLIKNGQTGILFEPDNFTSLQEKLVMLIEDSGLRKSLGENARWEVVNHCTWSKNARMTAELAENLIRKYRFNRASKAHSGQ